MMIEITSFTVCRNLEIVPPCEAYSVLVYDFSHSSYTFSRQRKLYSFGERPTVENADAHTHIAFYHFIVAFAFTDLPRLYGAAEHPFE